MRITLSVLLTALACVGGCATTPEAPAADVPATMAHLSVRERVNFRFVPGSDGILSVNGKPVAGAPARDAWIPPGRNTIGYACPGWVTVDGPATLTRSFAAGARYELTCEDPPGIQQVAATP